jgi:hypothetical protein
MSHDSFVSDTSFVVHTRIQDCGQIAADERIYLPCDVFSKPTGVSRLLVSSVHQRD